MTKPIGISADNEHIDDSPSDIGPPEGGAQRQ